MYKCIQIVSISVICCILDISSYNDMLLLTSYCTSGLTILDIDCMCNKKSIGLLQWTVYKLAVEFYKNKDTVFWMFTARY